VEKGNDTVRWRRKEKRERILKEVIAKKGHIALPI